MRISKRLIKRIANSLFSQKGPVSQKEIHSEIERVLGRRLKTNEKTRITLVLRYEYKVVKTEKDKDNTKVVYFEFY